MRSKAPDFSGLFLSRSALELLELAQELSVPAAPCLIPATPTVPDKLKTRQEISRSQLYGPRNDVTQ